jgi:peroxiredoxin family protein
MSSPTPSGPDAVDMAALVDRVEELEAAVAASGDPGGVAALTDRVETLEAAMAASEDDELRLTIIATKGTFDMAYPPLILASTAAAFGWKVEVFCTFWGLNLLHEEKSKGLKLSSVGNPNTPVPNVLGALPGMDAVTTKMMARQIEKNGTPSIEELIDTSLEMGADLQACQMTMEMMGYDEADLYEGVTTGVGAATALLHMADADVQLVI